MQYKPLLFFGFLAIVLYAFFALPSGDIEESEKSGKKDVNVDSENIILETENVNVASEIEKEPNVNPMVKTGSQLERNEFEVVVSVVSTMGVGKSCRVHMVTQGNPDNQAVILLHGAKYSSHTWKTINTYSILSGNGYYAIGIDLPGRGKSPRCDDISVSDFLFVFLERLSLKNRPIFVSPSMSGRFVSGFLTNTKKLQGREISEVITGIVWVAPALSAAEDELVTLFRTTIGVPFLITYGERDRIGKRTVDILSQNPRSVIKIIPNAGHACYLDDTNLFHSNLLTWLASIQNPNENV